MTALFSSSRVAKVSTLLLLGGIAAGCSGSNGAASNGSASANADSANNAAGASATTATTTAPTAASATPSDSSSMASSTGASGQGSPDQQFLEKMSDHHAGLILMAHETVDHSGPLAVKDEAKKFDSEQDDELARMKNALKSEFGVPSYSPKAMPEHQAMADSLKTLSGTAYDRRFREDVIKHHQEAIAMIDQYLPQMTHADVKTMAERMRANETKEIAQLKAQLGNP